MTLLVGLTPKASRQEIGAVASIEGRSVLTAKVRAAPDKGKANAALTGLVADWLGVYKSGVSVVRGVTSRLKTVQIAGDANALAARLEELLAQAR